MLFLFAAEYYFPLCECYTVVYPSMINEHLGHFQVLSIKNKAYLKQKKEKSICNDFTEAVSLKKKGSSSRTNLTTLINSMVSLSLSLSHTHTHTHFHTQSCLTVFHPMDCSPPGSTVHGMLQARILEWVAMLSSRGSSQPRDQTHMFYVSCTGRWVLYL